MALRMGWHTGLVGAREVQVNPPLINWWASAPKRDIDGARLPWVQWAIELSVGVLLGGGLVLLGWGVSQIWQRQQIKEQEVLWHQEQAQQQRRLQQVAQESQRQLQALFQLQQDQHHHLQAMTGQWLQHLPRGISWQSIEWSATSQEWRLNGRAPSHREAWLAFQQARQHELWGSRLRWESAGGSSKAGTKRLTSRTPGVDVIWGWTSQNATSENLKKQSQQDAGS